eukprot:COSAG01_NODE_55551_length_324_cov_0.911111_1_plen_59_part_10
MSLNFWVSHGSFRLAGKPCQASQPLVRRKRWVFRNGDGLCGRVHVEEPGGSTVGCVRFV